MPSFINAFMANDDVSRNQSIRNIMSELVPRVFTFDMLHPDFCAKMLAEVILIVFYFYFLYTLLFIFSYQILIS